MFFYSGPDHVVLSSPRAIGYKGEFSDVYKGERGGTFVAIKIFRVNIKEQPEKTLAVDRRLKRESAVWTALSHPNVLPFLGLYNGPELSMGMVSPWMERGNIMDHLRRFPNTDRSLLIRDVASGLAYLHSKPIIHGDLRGNNILINDDKRACIADFGLSRILEPISEHFPVGGSVRWMAPELLHHGESRETPASDVYSFACTCYEIYTGDPPFHNIPSVFDVIIAVYHHKRLPRPPSTHIAASIWGLMESCWDTISDARPNATDIYDFLAAIPRSPTTQASDEDTQLQGSVDTDISADDFRRDISVQGRPLGCEDLLSRL